MPIIGEKVLDSVSADDFEKILYNPQKQLSESTLSTIKYVLINVLKYENYSYQLPKQLISQKSLSNSKKYIEIFTPEEQQLLLTTLLRDIDSRKLGILICLFSGLRLGEICSLMTKDISLKNKTLLS